LKTAPTLLTALLSNRWFAFVAVGLIALYVACMLFVPSLPIAGPNGEIEPISRAEYWLFLMASFESIWSQWTEGYSATLRDRAPLLGCTVVWLGIAMILGWPIVRRDRLPKVVGSANALGFSVAAGSAIASLCVAFNAATFGPQSGMGLLAWFSGMGGIVYLLTTRLSKQEYQEPSIDRAAVIQPDPALEYSWARRWMGLTGVGIAWVLVLTLAGACLPSYDADVREYRNMAARRSYIENRISRSEQSPAMNRPQGSMMPALFWMNPLVGSPPFPLDAKSVRGMVDAVLVGQMVQGIQWWVALGLLLASLMRCFGAFAAILAGFAIAACPGWFELVRLGGGAGEGGLYLIASVSLLMLGSTRPIPVASLACIAAGAVGQGGVMFLLVSVPILAHIAIAPGILRRTYLLISVSIAVGGVVLFWGIASFVPFTETRLESGGAGGAWDACRRIAMWSTAHTLHLIPFAVIGMFVSKHRSARDAGVGFGVWCLVWWFWTGRQDRDWVIALPLLAWPMAGGIAWMRERGQGGGLAAICSVAWSWSILVLCAWPIADNRLLVPLNVLAPIVLTDAPQAGKGRGGAEPGDLATSVNQTWMTLASEYQTERWLLVGSADAFRWIPQAVLAGTWDLDPWEGIVHSESSKSDEEIAAAVRTLSRDGLRYLVFDWAGLSHLDHFDGRDRCSTYRDRILRLQRSGTLRLIEWELPSNRAQCFEIIDQVRVATRVSS